MLSLNDNSLDEEDVNLLDEVVIDRICLDELIKLCKSDVSIVSTEGNEERNSICARSMMKRVCLLVYADWPRGSRVCTRKITCQVAYGQKRSKSAKPGVTTMLLTHCIG